MRVWFTELVGDKDILDSTKIPIADVANLVAETGAAVTSLPTAVYRNKEFTRHLVDLGVLRFPDVDHPYFKVRLHSPVRVGSAKRHLQVYRIQLKAWAKCQRIGARQEDSNGIIGGERSRLSHGTQRCDLQP